MGMNFGMGVPFPMAASTTTTTTTTIKNPAKQRKCAFHSDRDPMFACTGCKAALCGDCGAGTSGKVFCRRCAGPAAAELRAIRDRGDFGMAGLPGMGMMNNMMGQMGMGDMFAGMGFMGGKQPQQQPGYSAGPPAKSAFQTASDARLDAEIQLLERHANGM